MPCFSSLWVLPDYLFFSVSFSNAGMEIAFLLSCTNPVPVNHSVLFDTLIRVSSIKLAKSSILILRIFFPFRASWNAVPKNSVFFLLYYLCGCSIIFRMPLVPDYSEYLNS